MKKLFRFLMLFGIAVLIGMGIHNCTEIKNVLYQLGGKKEANEHRENNVLIKSGGLTSNISGSMTLIKPSKIYTVKYRFECPDGLDCSVYYTYKKYPDSDWSNVITHFGPKSYPPQINQFVEIEFKVKPPFTAQVTCHPKCDYKEILVSVFVNNNLIDQKIAVKHYKEIVCQIN